MPPSLMLTLISAVASIAIGFLSGWTVNGWRLSAEIATIQKEQSAAVLQGVQTAMKDQTKYQKDKDEALLKAERRASTLEAAAAFAGSESQRLRDTLSATTAAIDKASESSVRTYAAAADSVLSDCSRSYTDMAAKADRHSSSQQTLVDAWPKQETK